MAASHPPHTSDPARIKVHGRRKGHPLRGRQQQLVETLLPRLRLNLARPFPGTEALFGRPLGELWLEIGFGGAEHLLWQAARHPDIGLIGSEPFVNGVAKALAGIEAQGLDNIRLHDDDARDVLDWLPDGALGRVFLLHPDPWPKKRHWKRRFINADNVARLARVMRPGGELRIASDIADHTDWILRHLTARTGFSWTARRPADWRLPPPDWPATRYGQKAEAAGRACAYLSFRRSGT